MTRHWEEVVSLECEYCGQKYYDQWPREVFHICIKREGDIFIFVSMKWAFYREGGTMGGREGGTMGGREGGIYYKIYIERVRLFSTFVSMKWAFYREGGKIGGREGENMGGREEGIYYKIYIERGRLFSTFVSMMWAFYREGGREAFIIKRFVQARVNGGSNYDSLKAFFYICIYEVGFLQGGREYGREGGIYYKI